MPKILPISALRNNFNDISETFHKDAEPVSLELINKIDYAISSLSQFPYKGDSPKDYHLK